MAYAQQRLESACTSVQVDSCLCWVFRTKAIMRLTVNALTRLHGCTGWPFFAGCIVHNVHRLLVLNFFLCSTTNNHCKTGWFWKWWFVLEQIFHVYLWLTHTKIAIKFLYELGHAKPYTGVTVQPAISFYRTRLSGSITMTTFIICNIPQT